MLSPWSPRGWGEASMAPEMLTLRMLAAQASGLSWPWASRRRALAMRLTLARAPRRTTRARTSLG